MSMNNRPPNFKYFDGYLYRLERWWYNDDYTEMRCDYVPDDDLPHIDQVKHVKIDVENS